MKSRVAIIESGLVEESWVLFQESCNNLKVTLLHSSEETMVMVASATETLTHYGGGGGGGGRGEVVC